MWAKGKFLISFGNTLASRHWKEFHIMDIPAFTLAQNLPELATEVLTKVILDTEHVWGRQWRIHINSSLVNWNDGVV